jgi:hypothetical protein
VPRWPFRAPFRDPEKSSPASGPAMLCRRQIPHAATMPDHSKAPVPVPVSACRGYDYVVTLDVLRRMAKSAPSKGCRRHSANSSGMPFRRSSRHRRPRLLPPSQKRQHRARAARSAKVIAMLRREGGTETGFAPAPDGLTTPLDWRSLQRPRFLVLSSLRLLIGDDVPPRSFR